MVTLRRANGLIFWLPPPLPCTTEKNLEQVFGELAFWLLSGPQHYVQGLSPLWVSISLPLKREIKLNEK